MIFLSAIPQEQFLQMKGMLVAVQTSSGSQVSPVLAPFTLASAEVDQLRANLEGMLTQHPLKEN